MVEQFLVHHGILGMHWGVRRYQNSDGTLTSAGKKRYEKISTSEIGKKIDTSHARVILKRRANENASMSEYYSKKSVKLDEKSKKYAKDTLKNKELKEKSKEAYKLSKEYEKSSNLATKKLEDIEKGKLKAGRDFIVQRDLNINLTKFPFYSKTYKQIYSTNINEITKLNPWFGSVDYKLIEKKK